MSRALPLLTSTGDPAHTALETNVRRLADQMHQQLNDTTGEQVAYTPAVAANWTGTPPTTIAAALDRIAAALGPIA